MKTYFPILFIAVFFLFSCENEKKRTQDQLLDKVMALHDEIMPKMGDIMKYKKHSRRLNVSIMYSDLCKHSVCY